MKRFAIITLILTLLLAVPALAEEATATAEQETIQAFQMDWDDNAISAFVEAGFEGTMITATLPDGVQFEMMLPAGFEQRDLTDEEAELGMNFAFANAETGASIRIMESVVEACNNLEEMAATMQADMPISTLQYALINGQPAVITTIEEYNAANVTFDVGEHRFIQFEFTPVTGNDKLVPFFMAAIQF